MIIEYYIGTMVDDALVILSQFGGFPDKEALAVKTASLEMEDAIAVKKEYGSGDLLKFKTKDGEEIEGTFIELYKDSILINTTSDTNSVNIGERQQVKKKHLVW